MKTLLLLMLAIPPQAPKPPQAPPCEETRWLTISVREGSAVLWLVTTDGRTGAKYPDFREARAEADRRNSGESATPQPKTPALKTQCGCLDGAPCACSGGCDCASRPRAAKPATQAPGVYAPGAAPAVQMRAAPVRRLFRGRASGACSS